MSAQKAERAHPLPSQKKINSLDHKPIRRQDFALSAAPEPAKGTEPKDVAQTNEDLRRMKKECQEKHERRMEQLRQAEAEHQNVFDELYRKAMDQQKHLEQLRTQNEHA